MVDRPAIAERCTQSFADWVGAQPSVVSWAPGRINVIGGHTDYNNGLALPAAINRWIAVALLPREDGLIRVRSLDFDALYESRLDAPTRPQETWQKFVAGVIQVFSEQQGFPSGFDAVFVGDVPCGAGLSSSAALTVAGITAFRSWVGADLDDWSLVRLCQQVEHQHLGVQCGLLDQVASHMARPGHVMQIDFQELSVDQIPVRLPNVSWVVLHSGVRRELSKSAYSDRVRECATGLRSVQAQFGTVSGMRDVRLHHLPEQPVWGRRLRHVVTENRRVAEAAQCVARGDVQSLGQLLGQTHESLREDYEVSCPELDSLVQIAVADPDCWGARMVGGGFGGCTLNLVRSDQTEVFIQRTLEAYQSRFDRTPRSFCFSLVGGAQVG